MGRLLCYAEPFRSKNLILQVLETAGQPVEESYLVAILQRLQYKYCFPLRHVFGKQGYLRSPSVEEDLHDLATANMIKIKRGSKILELCEKGRLRTRAQSMMDEDDLLTVKKVVEQICKLPLEKVRATAEVEFLSYEFSTST